MLIKICGITTVETALSVARSGANMIGFVFAPSKREISPSGAAEISEKLPNSLKRVGVFVNETKENIMAIAEVVGLDYIQLHGDEPASFARNLPLPIIKAFSIDELEEMESLEYPCEFMLVDSPGTTHRGGSGYVFDWDRLLALNIDRQKLILAGGLAIHNVQEAITAINPAGIDVSSGVETNGAKDSNKIWQFVATARGR